MKGRIEIICDDKGLHMDVKVKTSGEADRVFLVHALGRALELTPEDYLVLSLAEATGALDDLGTPKAITIDREELLKQLKEEQL